MSFPKGIYQGYGFVKGSVPWNKGLKGTIGNNKGKHWKVKDTSKMKGRIPIKDRSLLKTDRKKSYDTRYKYWMIEVKKRDSWKCRTNDKNCKGRLEAHHILSWRNNPGLRYELSNGIALCRFHHPYKRSEEQQFAQIFQELVKTT